LSTKIYIDWNDDEYTWDNIPYFWEDAARVVQDAVTQLGGGGGGSLVLPKEQPWREVEKKLDPVTAKKFFEVIVEVKGVDKKYKREKPDPMTLTVKDIQKTINHFGYKDRVKIKVDVKK
jgi:hypothetical protein